MVSGVFALGDVSFVWVLFWVCFAGTSAVGSPFRYGSGSFLDFVHIFFSGEFLLALSPLVFVGGLWNVSCFFPRKQILKKKPRPYVF